MVLWAKRRNTTTMGVTFIVKRHSGMTRRLSTSTSLLTTLDGPYPFSTATAVLKADRLLLLGGGIGITGLIAWSDLHPSTTLHWSVKVTSQSLVEEMRPALSHFREKHILIGERFNIRCLLDREMGCNHERIGVVVCGPATMCDEARGIVAGLGRAGKTVFELHVDAFSW